MPGESVTAVILSTIIGELVLLAVVAGLVRRYLRTRVVQILYLVVPLVGIGLATAMAALYNTGQAPLPAGSPLPPVSVAVQVLWAVAVTAFHLGILHFNLQVFHRGERRPWLIAGMLALVWLWAWGYEPIALPHTHGLYYPWRQYAVPGAIGMGTVILIWGWSAYNNLTHWRLYRGDIARGKDRDPLIVHRFLLWGIGSLGVVIAQPIGPAPADFRTGISPVVMGVVLVCYLVAGFSAYVGWAPPKWYQRRVLHLDA